VVERVELQIGETYKVESAPPEVYLIFLHQEELAADRQSDDRSVPVLKATSVSSVKIDNVWVWAR
jgi:hypothetical protein